jgi:hypothetical protein
VNYFIYQSSFQTERRRSEAEQREFDRVNAELVASFAQLAHSVATPWRSLQHALYGRRRSRAAARLEPRPHRAERVDGLVPCPEHQEDNARSCSLASPSRTPTRQLSRR